MAEVTLDRGTAVFIGHELDKIRQALKEDKSRWDIYPADRRDINIYEDALNVVIRNIGAQRPVKQAKEIGGLIYLVVPDWGDEIDVFEVPADELDATVQSFKDDGAVDVQVFKGLKSTGEDVTVYQTPELAPPEVAEERRLEVERRKREIAEGKFTRQHGNAPKFRVERS